jgi:hypothetical protein
MQVSVLNQCARIEVPALPYNSFPHGPEVLFQVPEQAP